VVSVERLWGRVRDGVGQGGQTIPLPRSLPSYRAGRPRKQTSVEAGGVERHVGGGGGWRL